MLWPYDVTHLLFFRLFHKQTSKVHVYIIVFIAATVFHSGINLLNLKYHKMLWLGTGYQSVFWSYPAKKMPSASNLRAYFAGLPLYFRARHHVPCQALPLQSLVLKSGFTAKLLVRLGKLFFWEPSLKLSKIPFWSPDVFWHISDMLLTWVASIENRWKDLVVISWYDRTEKNGLTMQDAICLHETRSLLHVTNFISLSLSRLRGIFAIWTVRELRYGDIALHKYTLRLVPYH